MKKTTTNPSRNTLESLGLIDKMFMGNDSCAREKDIFVLFFFFCASPKKISCIVKVILNRNYAREVYEILKQKKEKSIIPFRDDAIWEKRCKDVYKGGSSPTKFHEVFFMFFIVLIFLCSVGCNILYIYIITTTF